MNDYVVGFNFICPDISNGAAEPAQVVLIEKQRPDWQKGRLNGVGGHVELSESPWDAMAREYAEETGDENKPAWVYCLTMHIGDCRIYFFKAFSSSTTAHTTTDEKVHVVPLNALPDDRLLPNLRWLIPFARTAERGMMYIE